MDGMSALLVALGYAWFSHGIAFLLMPWSLSFGYRLRALAVWGLSAMTLFVLQEPLPVILSVGAATFLLAPFDPSQRASFFLIAAPCLPVFLTAQLDFPGLESLMEISPYKIVALAIFIPLFITESIGAKRPNRVSLLDALIASYIIYTAAIVAGAISPTAGLRHLVNEAMTTALPYFGLRFAIRTMSDVEQSLDAFFVASIILAAIALVSVYKQWNFYFLLQPDTIFFVPDLRSGFLRIQATANTHSLAYHLAAALIFLEVQKGRLRLGMINLLAIRSAFLIAIYFTDSRGAMLSLVIATIGFIMVSLQSNIVRSAVLAGLILASVFGSLWLLFGDITAADAYGSAGYRQEVFRIGSDQVLKHPIFGDYNFYDNPVFEPLRQGQGIIDITNLYLLVLLHYGGVGALMLFTVMAAPIVMLVRRAYRLSNFAARTIQSAERVYNMPKSAANTGSESTAHLEARVLQWQRTAAVIVGAQAGWLFLVGTTSNVALTMHLGIFFAVIGRTLDQEAQDIEAAFKASRALRPSGQYGWLAP